MACPMERARAALAGGVLGGVLAGHSGCLIGIAVGIAWGSADTLDRTLYHGTSWENARRIEREGFRPSSDGCLGPGVYFAERDKATRFANHTSRHGGQPALVVARVRARTVKRVKGDDSRWQREGYDACYTTSTTTSTTARVVREEPLPG
eukprot:CAMPEP_0179056882 /NCGR_PEP_ID=MMETSP0796-20121207/24043_1 /TAXON_ID=73915 /ORGANISM="Pyrodinium bahamense, Strain pbaha01" /LENGTH=149 /DNA_ID=CAMNT_0020753575 /DNA_START=65 /DNA_END=514 /DNA_ORIENTATION=+